MATNLDRSLDEILDDKKKARRTTKKAGPIGGVRKRSARIEQKKRAAPVAPPAPAKKADNKKDKTDTKIQVSNLPLDVNESMLREYFTSIVGPIKKCNLVYKANGQSAGIATLEFNKPGHANVAFEQFNGRLVDNRPMKVEIIVDPSKVSFADRISGAPKGVPKAAPKPVAKPKPVTATNGRANGAAATRGNARGGRGGRGRKGTSGSGTNRSKKTVEQLDQEMADYYKGSENAAPPAAAPTATEAAVMEDL
jgi:THO complex subunit 4